MGELAYSIKLETMDCPSCFAAYAISKEFINHRRQDGKWWPCPYCQQATSFEENDHDRLRKQLEQATKDRDWYKTNAASERAAREESERQLWAQREATERLKKRVKNGVCPCCTRSFTNLREHIKTKHPGYVAEKIKSPSKKKRSYVEERLAEIKKEAP